MFLKPFPEFLQWFGTGAFGAEAFRHPSQIIFSSTQIVSVQSKKKDHDQISFY